MHKGEANALEWRDVDFEAGEIVVRGDDGTATKNWELRHVPLIPDARTLFQRMRSDRADEPLDVRVFRSANARRLLIEHAKKSAQIASRTMICDICSQRAALKVAWIFQL